MSKNFEVKERATVYDLQSFVSEQPRRYIDIINYLTKEITKKSIVNPTKANKLFHEALDKGMIIWTAKIDERRGVYTVPNAQNNNTETELSKTMEEKRQIAIDLDETSKLLKSLNIILEFFNPRKIDVIIRPEYNEFKIKWDELILEFETIRKNYPNPNYSSEEEFLPKLNTLVEGFKSSSNGIGILEPFKQIFCYVILDIHNKCIKIKSKYTYDKSNTAEFIKKTCIFVASSINLMCRTNIDLIVKQFHYDKKTNRFVIDLQKWNMLDKLERSRVFDLVRNNQNKMHYYEINFSHITSDDITAVYCDGQLRTHVINSKEYEPLLLIRPCNDSHEHVITIRSKCVESSFTLKKSQRDLKNNNIFLQPKNDIAEILFDDFKYSKILTNTMGGDIPEFIESWDNKNTTCPICDKIHQCQGFLGTVLDDERFGKRISDENGTRYMTSIVCPETGYDFEFPKKKSI